MTKEKLSIMVAVLKNRLLPLKNPFFCTYIVTFRCNAKCRMCDIWKKKAQQEMDLEQIKKAFAKIKEIVVVRLTGGEPFLRKDILDISNIIKENTACKILHVTSNGILKDNIIDFAKNSKFNNLHIKISLTGAKASHDFNLGINGAWDKALETIEALKAIKRGRNFFLAVNHTITDWQSFLDSKEIRRLCSELKLGYLPVLAYQGPSLYADQQEKIDERRDFKPFTDFSQEQLREIFIELKANCKNIPDFFERAIKKYYLKGLSNRLLKDHEFPRPRCIALSKHIRFLPNGDIAVCLYNSQIVGNIVRDELSTILSSPKAKELQNWVNSCSDCWAECEVIPNALIKEKIPILFRL
ncbi:MAG: radical SAM protein [Candidatus Omnitrophica bacterium]|nr:radical SAM protein [Candidatus Omnitrophota bacterium]